MILCLRCLILLVSICTLPTSSGFGGEIEEGFGDLHLAEQWSGDFDGMVERKLIRVLVVHNKMLYFLDQGRQRGVNVDMFDAFKKFINKKEKSGTVKIKILFLPVQRDQLFTALAEGRGDIVAANLTITPERQKLVDFSNPLLKGVKEIVVAGPGQPELRSIDDLAGKELHLRPSSSYYQHVVTLNRDFEQRGLAPIMIVEASEFLEDSDLLEMVNAGLIPMVIVDDHKARFWAEIFEKVILYHDIAVNEGGEIAWAFRNDSPKLAAVINEFVQQHRKGSLLGNIIFKRYLKDNKWARNALDPEEMGKFEKVVGLFEKYADTYDFDYLMTGALAYQESQLDHSKKSHVGALGIMQILPSTAAGKNVGIPDIEQLEKNIHAGHKYLRFIQDRYFNDPQIDTLNKYLFTFAAYNAGPAKVNRLRQEAEKKGLDPNVWFQNVEVIAAKRIGRETVQYVSNIYKYYISYKLAQDKAGRGKGKPK
ncbi:lytic transglycosylase F [Desulfogranum marinum]|uniref:transglycosylase SLT domain-containing protein n=1 Tax=Desulfogranum marinum TaxID=453220 RepID=UPI0029C690B7|nr:lytic transglycosylase F [Desulfogranum marinum]